LKKSYDAFCNYRQNEPVKPKRFKELLEESGHTPTNIGTGRAGNKTQVNGLQFNLVAVEVTEKESGNKKYYEWMKNK
jgi:hypothetical protein